MTDARFYSCSGSQCKKKQGYEGDNVVEWVEDCSMCLKKMPSKQTAFVDWSFDLTDVAMNQWESSVKADLVMILISNMRVMEREINSVLARDITDEQLKLNVCC